MSTAEAPNPIRVVVVDDSEEIRLVLRLAFDREPGFDLVAEAPDGRSGVVAVAANKPHLVLLDLSLPEIDGLQALPLIRAESPGSIVIMLTGYPPASAAETAGALGAHGYIQKGVGIPELMAELRAVVTRELDDSPSP